MEHPLIFTKLNIPAVSEHIQRPRLFARFEQALSATLVLVAAPAGFGKTTLIASWASQTSQPIAWLSLEKQDNDFTRFFTYFIHSLQIVEPDMGKRSSSILKTQHIPSFEDLFGELINEINNINRQLIVVLDDFNSIKSNKICNALYFLIEHAPPNFHLIMSTRVDPLFSLARFRGKGKIIEIRNTELRFSYQETQDYLQNIMNIELQEHHLHKLVRHTEGWIAGIQMAAVSLLKHPDVDEFFEHFCGTHRYILDYLLDEVFKQQSQEIQDFLLKTSVLNSFSADLCNYITQRTDSRKVIEYLINNNLFIIPLDSDFNWFRYHQLFAEILLAPLRYTYPDSVQTLHQRAGQWFRDQNKIEPAITHFLQAEDYAAATELLQKALPTFLQRSEFITVVEWARKIPQDYLKKYPHLCTSIATLMLITGEPTDKIMNTFQACDNSLSNPNEQGDVQAFQSILCALQGKTNQSIAHAHRAFELLSDKEQFYRTFLLHYLYTMQYFKSGDVGAALDTIQRTILHLDSHINNPESLPGKLQLLSRQAKLYHLKAELHSAHRICKEILSLTEKSTGIYLPIAGTALIEMADIYREWNHLERAFELIQKGIAYNENWSILNTIEGYIIKTEILYAQHKIEAAEKSIQKAKNLAYAHDAAKLDDLWVDIYQTRLLLIKGDIEASNTHIEFQNTNYADASDENYHFKELQQVLMVRLHISKGEYRAALDKLPQYIKKAQELQRFHSLIELKILMVCALYRLEQLDKARQCLLEILPQAAKERYTRIFLDEGEPIKRILSTLHQPNYTSYLHKLINAFNDHQKDADSQQLLSTRELEVLHLLSQGLSNREISDQLCISIRTVKWHTSNIYEKLECKNRTEAVRLARDKKILT